MLQKSFRKLIRLPFLSVPFFILFLPIFVMAENSKDISTDDPCKEFNPNIIFDDLLEGQTLKFYKLNKGMDIPLNSIIIMPQLGEEGLLSIELPRNLVEERFIKDMFYEKNENVTTFHPFTEKGIEPILTKDKLILNVHSGVILHLRNDMQVFPKYKTFRSVEITGKVTKVKGKVLCSSDQQLIKTKLHDVFVWWHAPSSGIAPETKGKPQKYSPKIIELLKTNRLKPRKEKRKGGQTYKIQFKTFKTDPNGSTITHENDAVYRLIRKVAPDDMVGYNYDVMDNLLSVSDSDSSLTMALELK